MWHFLPIVKFISLTYIEINISARTYRETQKEDRQSMCAHKAGNFIISAVMIHKGNIEGYHGDIYVEIWNTGFHGSPKYM